MTVGRFLSLVVLAAGFGLAAGGGYAYAFAVRMPTDSDVTAQGYGPFTGTWGAPHLCFLAATLSSVGVGLVVLGLGLVVTGSRAGGGRWVRVVLWSAVGCAVVGGVVALAVLARVVVLKPGMAEEDRDAAGEVAIGYVTGLEAGRVNPDLVTEDFARRLAAEPERVVYAGRTSWKTDSEKPGEATTTVAIRATGKTTTWATDHGATKATISFPDRKLVKLLVRTVKGADGKWRVDGVDVREP